MRSLESACSSKSTGSSCVKCPASIDPSADTPDEVRNSEWRDVTRFIDWLRDLAGGIERAADYFHADRPTGPASVAQPYKFIQPERCSPQAPIRWTTFDAADGQEGFLMHEDGQPGIVDAMNATDAARARSLIDTGARIWTQVEGSKANIAVTGTTAATLALDDASQPNDVNAITFEDPGDAVDGDFDTSGILAVTATWFDCSLAYDVGGARVYEIVEADITTQDGFGALISSLPDSETWFAEVLAHELGHALGLAHPCEIEELQAGTCMPPESEALMKATPGFEPSGAVLGEDDIAAIRALYDVNNNPPITPDPPIEPSLWADFEPPTGVVAGVPAVFDAGKSRGGDSYLWDFGDGTPAVRVPEYQEQIIHTYQVAGKFTVTLEAARGDCSYYCVTDSTSRVVVVAPDPTPRADFLFEGLCADGLCHARTNEPVRFRDRSGGEVTAWDWDFGDGTTSAVPNPSHRWSAPGFYEVVLSVSGAGATSTALRTVLVEAAVPAGACEADAETLCLHDSRFAVRARWWRETDEESFAARVVRSGTNDSGLFEFFGRNNWELLVKVLDGCALNGHVWVYGAASTDLGYSVTVTDTADGAEDPVAEYRNEPGTPSPAIVDPAAFSMACGAASSLSASVAQLPAPRVAALSDSAGGFGKAFRSLVGERAGVACSAASDAFCLHDGRFEVRATWRDASGSGGRAAPAVRGTTDSAVLHFFGAGNWEMLVKVLDGCGINQHYWVAVAAATDLGYDVVVTDRETGRVQTYGKEPGDIGPAVVHTGAFPDSCRNAAD